MGNKDKIDDREDGMDEEQWLSCGDAIPMLEYLAGKIPERKLRLFSCACCRRIWHLMNDLRCRLAIEMAEELAEGTAPPVELERSRSQAADAREEADEAAYQEEFDIYPYTEKVTNVKVSVQSTAAALAAVSENVLVNHFMTNVAAAALLLLLLLRNSTSMPRFLWVTI